MVIIENLISMDTLVNRIDRVLLAYKPFYFGCSRAKKIEFVSKMKDINFVVKLESNDKIRSNAT